MGFASSSISSSILSSSILLFLFCFAFFAARVDAVISFPEGSDLIDLSSNNFPSTNFSGPLCAPLALLKLKPGCVIDHVGSDIITSSSVVDADTFQLYCVHYNDVIKQLPDHVAGGRKVVVFPSPYTTEVGTLSEPFGELDRAQELVARGVYAFVVVSRVAGMIVTENREADICVSSDKGPFPTFFSSPGWIAYQVIMCICFGIILVFSWGVLILGLREKFHLLRFVLIFSASFMALLRLLEFAIDYQNHLGRINVVSWGFLNLAGACCFFSCSSLLLNAWAQVARHTLTHKRTKWVLTFLRINVFIFIPAVLLYLLTSLLRWGLPQQVSAVVPFIFSALVLLFAIVVVVSFIVLGGRLLYLINSAITKDHAVVLRITVITMTSSVCVLVCVIVIAARLYYGVVLQDVTFASNMCLLVFIEICEIIMGAGVVLAFSFNTLRNLTTTVTGAEQSNRKDQTNSQNASAALSSGNPGHSTLEDVDEIIMDLRGKKPSEAPEAAEV